MERLAFYRTEVGDLTVTALSDGYIKGGEGILVNIDKEAAHGTLRACDRLPKLVDVNAFLIESAGRSLLVDTGSGRSMGRNAGALSASLDAAGISPSQIDAVFLTHIHPDHSGGLTGEEGPRFPNAELVVNETEYAFWMDDANKQRVDAKQHAMFFDGARSQLAPYRERLRFVTNGEIVPGVTSQLSPGHTPGHSICLLSSGSKRLMIWGDTVHIPEVQTLYPGAGVVFDVNPAAAAESRRRIFDMAAIDRIPVMGMHVDFAGQMELERSGRGYRLIKR